MMPFKNDEISKMEMYKSIALFMANDAPQRRHRYHKDLPAELERWYEYLSDAGHCIHCLPCKIKMFDSKEKSFLNEEHNSILKQFDIEKLLLQSDSEIRNWLVPASVKAVQRGYRIVRGYVVSNLEYCSFLGLIQEDEDDEY